MYDTKKDKWMVAGGWVLIIGFILVCLFILPKIESVYYYVGDKVPFLGRVFAWAEEVTS
ncbi:hypothetical protein [Paenibacillus harenae]|uniref:hypothetical protein n=1 Tax=Paenibacillus harenae TaxID=306543 RepID=UPI000402B67A|nr:hypothetical protein [Paenibacillus harenae]